MDFLAWMLKLLLMGVGVLIVGMALGGQLDSAPATVTVGDVTMSINSGGIGTERRVICLLMLLAAVFAWGRSRLSRTATCVTIGLALVAFCFWALGSYQLYSATGYMDNLFLRRATVWDIMILISVSVALALAFLSATRGSTNPPDK